MELVAAEEGLLQRILNQWDQVVVPERVEPLGDVVARICRVYWTRQKVTQPYM